MMMELTINQTDYTRKWPRIRSAEIELKTPSGWNAVSRKPVRLGRIGYQNLRIRATLPANKSRIRARYILRAGKRILVRGRSQLVKRGGPHLELRSVTAGSGATCGVLISRRAVCWGRGTYGELGIGRAPRHVLLPVRVKRLGKVASVSISSGFACAILIDRRASCWGSNSDGTLGTGDQRDSLLPRPVKRLKNVRQIRLSGYNACAVMIKGTVSCWGSNGAFGVRGSTRVVPRRVKGIDDAYAISAGGRVTCAIRRNHRVVCWNMRTFKLRPKRHLGQVKAIQIADEYSGCAIRVSDRLICWGGNSDGQLGIGTREPRRGPVLVRGAGKVRDVTTDGQRVCVVRISGRLLCWGNNYLGDLGTGDFRYRLRPTPVPGMRDVRSIEGQSLGGACGIRRDDSAFCWGDNSAGSLGTGTLVNQLLPATVLTKGRPIEHP